MGEPPPSHPAADQPGDKDGAARRTIDIIVSSIGILALSPLLVLIAFLIRVTMGPPVLFRQRRSGRHGVEFAIIKFRTMHPERYAGEPDPDRISTVGRFLRATSLDELPQLWNILRGDMSLIGPRPTLPEQVARYNARQRRRLEVRPGLTGWTQVNGRNALSWPERIELDIWYVDRRSLWLDLRILCRTAAQLVSPRGVTDPSGINPGFPGTTSPDPFPERD